MVLVNGSKGIGTGFSTDIMCYNPLEIINYIECKLNNKIYPNLSFIPYYDGFNGTIVKITDTKFIIKGVYEKIGVDKIRVTELPVGFWTDNFKEHLENLIDNSNNNNNKKTPAIIKDYQDNSKDTNVDFTIIFTKGVLDELEATKHDNDCNGVEKLLKLSTTNTTTNMHLFDAQDKLKKYITVTDIIDDYFVTRLDMYNKRKIYLINALQQELLLLSNKVKYINEILNGSIDLRNKRKIEIVSLLKNKGYDIIDTDIDYKYLIKLPMDSVTDENVRKLNDEYNSKLIDLNDINNTTTKHMWLTELASLRDVYIEFKEDKARSIKGDVKKKIISKGTKKITIVSE